jgi:hypothetical protein
MSIQPQQVKSWKAELGGDAEIAALLDQALDQAQPMPGVTTALGGRLNAVHRTRLMEILSQIKDQRGTNFG